MAIIDNLQKISDTIWELPASYKQGMRVAARIIATEKLVATGFITTANRARHVIASIDEVLAADIAVRRKLASNR